VRAIASRDAFADAALVANPAHAHVQINPCILFAQSLYIRLSSARDMVER
jgi:hypothetical protein